MLWQEVAEGDKKVSSQVCNVLLIGFTLAATFLRRHSTLLSQLRPQIQTLSMFFFFFFALYAACAVTLGGDWVITQLPNMTSQSRTKLQLCLAVKVFHW